MDWITFAFGIATGATIAAMATYAIIERYKFQRADTIIDEAIAHREKMNEDLRTIQTIRDEILEIRNKEK